MEVKLAKSAGFCFGVKRAVDKVYEQIETGKKIYTYGPIIHNEEVVKDLASKGVCVIENEEELRNLKEGTVIIRSHGVAKDIYRIIEENGLEYEDATCPFVKRIHSIVEKESGEGKQIIIIGNEGHPEVEGIRGWASTPAIVVESHEQAEEITIESDKKVCIVSQTTFNYRKFQELVEIFEKYGEMSPGSSRKVAREIVLLRRKKKFETTSELAALVNREHKAQVFQAIRIVVNDELGLIEKTLPLIPKLLKPGGRVAIITFHSLEDRLVKDYFKKESSLGEESELKLINKKPITAEHLELVINSRSRSAKLRAARKI